MSFQPLPAQWSIASCLFPHEENPTVPGPGPHPVLIAGVMKEKGLVLAAYGTGQSGIALAGGDLEPYQMEVDPNSRNYLRYVTRFDFRKAVPIEWNDSWFKPIGARVPIIMGSLDRTQIIAAKQAIEAYKQLLAGGTVKAWGATASAKALIQSGPVVAPQPAVVIFRKRRVVPLLGDNGDAAE
jgi:hypothetical protein